MATGQPVSEPKKLGYRFKTFSRESTIAILFLITSVMARCVLTLVRVAPAAIGESAEG